MDVVAIEFHMHVNKFRDVQVVLLSLDFMLKVRQWDISCLAGYSGPIHTLQATFFHSLSLEYLSHCHVTKSESCELFLAIILAGACQKGYLRMSPHQIG